MPRLAPKSAYDILGVTPADDFATIRRAWITLVKANHPDALGCSADEATGRLAQINDAYDALRWHNPEKLRIYREQQAQSRKQAAEKRATAEAANGSIRGHEYCTGQSVPKRIHPSRDGAEDRPATTSVRLDRGFLQALKAATANYRLVTEICNGGSRPTPSRVLGSA